MNVTKRPSLLIRAELQSALASAPEEATLSRVVMPVERSCRKTSRRPLVSFATRFDAVDSNATYRPSGVTTELVLAPFACVPPLATLTRTTPRGAAAAAAADARIGKTIVGPWPARFTLEAMKNAARTTAGREIFGAIAMTSQCGLPVRLKKTEQAG